MIKWIPTIFIILCMTGITLADKGSIETYKPGEVFDLSVHLTNVTGNVVGADCNIEIRNNSYGVITDGEMNEIGGGWYNYTYNTTNVGKYYCRQNCTQGDDYVSETCDFIIGVEDNMLLGMIIFIPLFIAAFLVVVSWMLPPERYAALKLALPIVGLFFVYQAYQYGTIAIAEFYNFSSLIDAIGENSFIYGMVIWVIIAILLITIVYDVFMLFKNKKHKTGEY